MKFNLNDYPGKVCMHCDTEEKAKKFCKFLNKNSLSWFTGVSYSEFNFFTMYKEDTCYFFNEGCYEDISYAIDEGYKILEFDDFDL